MNKTEGALANCRSYPFCKTASAVLFCTVALLLFSSVALSEAFRLPDTGQTKCYQDVSPWDEIPCAGTGQDGAYSINPMSFTDNGNGTVTDNNTGLMWQKCSVGQNNDAACSGSAQTYNWSQAVCGSLNLGGHSDWRLPSKKELITIVDYAIPYPAPTIRTAYFPNTAAFFYWSSTFGIGIGAWSVGFDGGRVDDLPMDMDNIYVRCVRGGQSPEQSFDDNNGNGTVHLHLVYSSRGAL